MPGGLGSATCGGRNRPDPALAIAVAAGLLVTTAVWPMQRRFDAMMRTRLPDAGQGGVAED
jgi:hypothetical protein